MNLNKTIKEEYDCCNEKTQDELSLLNTRVSDLLKNYKSYLRICEKGGPSTDINGHERDYGLAKIISRDLEYSSDDITQFCLAFVHNAPSRGPETQQLGLFISALINEHYKKNERIKNQSRSESMRNIDPERTIKSFHDLPHSFNKKELEYTIITGQEFSSETFSCLGAYNNGAKINIIGSCGDSLCLRMKTGDVFVRGSARNFIGIQMEGGNLTITDDANVVGTHMSDGKIIVHGKINLIDHGYRKCTGGEIYEKNYRMYP